MEMNTDYGPRVIVGHGAPVAIAVDGRDSGGHHSHTLLTKGEARKLIIALSEASGLSIELPRWTEREVHVKLPGSSNVLTKQWVVWDDLNESAIADRNGEVVLYPTRYHAREALKEIKLTGKAP